MYLIQKYDRPVPRYTSYPPVPYWQPVPPTESEWLGAVNARLRELPDLSLYVHLPFCEQLCTYCGCNKRITRNHGVEAPYIDALLAEWKRYLPALPAGTRIRELHLGGGTPTFFSPHHLGRLVAGILREVPAAAGADLSLEAHPNGTTPRHLAVLREYGFNRISVGVQDFSMDIMRIINRKQTTDQIYRTVDAARLLGYESVNFDLIYGLPTQQLADIERTAVHVAALRPDRIAYYGYAHVPWVSPGQRAYNEHDLPRGRAKHLLHERGNKLLEAEGYHNIGLDHFSLPTDTLYQSAIDGTLHRNFMGYTTGTTLTTIALGCSAIGDSWDTYVQNEKTVEDYQRAVLTEGHLPLVKGHRLSRDEQVVRRHILNLMCHQTTEWREENQRCAAVDRAVTHWNEMAADGLLTRSPYRIEVTSLGSPFLRNICLPLDDHHYLRQATGPLFSQSV